MQSQSSTPSSWLRAYYFARAIFSVAWVAAAILLSAQPALALLVLVIYPAWDALANLVDARVNGGLKANPSQALNVAVSTIMTLAVIAALSSSMYAVLAAFSGLLQLNTGIKRWRSYGAQWPMILSGAQSALAGGFMISRSIGTVAPTVRDIAPYAAFGAFYFLLSATWLAVTAYRKAAA